MCLINCKINLDLSCFENSVIVATNLANQIATFLIIDIKLYVPVLTLSTQENTKLFEQLKYGFKRTINWNKYKCRNSMEKPNKYLDYLIDPNFQGLNRLFVLSFQNEAQRTR